MITAAVAAIKWRFIFTALATSWLYTCGAFRSWVKRGAMEGRL